MLQVDALFTEYRDHVYAVCYRFMGNPERALDLAQDTLLKAYLKLPTFRGEAKFSTWLTAIARFECLNALRKGRDLLTEDGVLDAADPARSVLSKLRRQEREDLLREAAADVLEPHEQEAVYLRYTEHLPLAQIETLLQLDSASGARGLLQRCKRKLTRALRSRLEQLGHGTSFLRDSNG
ncbi:MAG: sigma-70 family RNA polymerase sigma factor [Myxococcales bacterium]|nr:sigma-70 family RNA polymerase sigma factor [Myxococcales bacterium]